MEEKMMMVMMNIETSPNITNRNAIVDHQSHHNLNIPMITSTISPAWKLYENPFYMISHSHSHHQQQQQEYFSDHNHIDHKQQIHKLHLPISARKIAASFWDLSFIKPLMESERARLSEVKAELESERKARKKMETLNKRLAREVSELERVCEELAKEISSDKAEISRMRREMEEERKMMRTAEVIREERVQMKLAEAKNLLEEKFSEMEMSSRKINVTAETSKVQQGMSEGDDGINSSMALMQRKRSCENPHIKRGIKGLVEFPKVIRAIGCRRSTKLECQKAQLKILLKQKGAVRFNGFIAR